MARPSPICYFEDAAGWWYYTLAFPDISVPLHGPFKMKAQAEKDREMWLTASLTNVATHAQYAHPSRRITPATGLILPL
jgi:hypothetical protein